jgi:hypothetical protein
MRNSGYAVLCAVALGAGLVFAAPANAMSLKDCNAEWSAKKSAKETNGEKYADFRKECLARTAAAPDAPPAPAPTAPAAPPPPKSAEAPPPTAPIAPTASGPAVFPSAVSSKYSSDKAGKARQETCRDQYTENKAANANGGLKWIQKGGGYWSECNKKLKGTA